jgi:UDP:flavonoid glycosyltransferase YjiC (YdhE family)
MQLVLGGCPLVVLPVMVEQAQCGYRLSRAGLAVGAQAKDGVRDAAAVRRVVGEPAYAERARAVAARYAGLDPAAQAVRIAERCERAAAS